MFSMYVQNIGFLLYGDVSVIDFHKKYPKFKVKSMQRSGTEAIGRVRSIGHYVTKLNEHNDICY